MKLFSKISPLFAENDFFIIAVALFSIALRLLPHLPNIAPIGAFAVITGLVASKKSRLFIPLFILFISDIFVGFYSLPMMASVYFSFLMMGVVGYLFQL